jgi:hypothetical protein
MSHYDDGLGACAFDGKKNFESQENRFINLTFFSALNVNLIRALH